MAPNIAVGTDVWQGLENMANALGFEDIPAALAEVAAAWRGQEAPVDKSPEAVRRAIEAVQGEVGAALEEGEAECAIARWLRENVTR